MHQPEGHTCRPIWIASRGAVCTKNDHWMQPAAAPQPPGSSR